jgi:hypothetical protein
LRRLQRRSLEHIKGPATNTNFPAGVVSIGIHGNIAAQENPLSPFFRRFFGSPGLEFQAVGSGVVVDAGRGYPHQQPPVENAGWGIGLAAPASTRLA